MKTAKIIPFPKFKKMTQEQRNKLIEEALENLRQVQEILMGLEKRHEERMRQEKTNEQKD